MRRVLRSHGLRRSRMCSSRVHKRHCASAMSNAYVDAMQRSREPEYELWREAAQQVHWEKPWDTVVDTTTHPTGRWFTGGLMNTCFNALDRHLDARADQPALIYDSAMTGQQYHLTYADLVDRVQRLSGVLHAQGLRKGDRVVIYMPMIPEATVAMLACARLGLIHSVVFGGFAAKELASRVDHATPRAVITASCGLEPNRVVPYKPLVDEALRLSTHKPDVCIVYDRDGVNHRDGMQELHMVDGRDFHWKELVDTATPFTDCVPVDSTDPLYILYTSGTTGQPKGVVRDNGGHAVALQWAMRHVYDVNPGDVFWAATDVGWVVGHSFLTYGPLLYGATALMYEGKPVGTPDAGAYWRIIEQYRVNTFFAAPTAFRAIKKEDPSGKLIRKHDLSSLRSVWVAGERADPNTIVWMQQHLKRPIIDHVWSTETGWPNAGQCLHYGEIAVKPGSCNRAIPGYDINILDAETGSPKEVGDIGEVVLRLPLPPGAFIGLWQSDDLFNRTYLSTFSGYFRTGDSGFIDEDHYVHVLSRVDDVINVAGHRLATGSLEEAIAQVEEVAECAVFGVEDPLKGQLPLALVVLKDSTSTGASPNGPGKHAAVEAAAIKMVRERVGPVAALKHVLSVPALPKTRSGKVLRITLRDMANGHNPWRVPPTIEDAGVLEPIHVAMQSIGYGTKA